VAVTVTRTAEVTAEVVAWTLPWLAPAGTFRVAGTLTEGRLLDKATFIPPAGAPVERFAVQRSGLPPVTMGGLQPKDVMVGRLDDGITVMDAVWEEPL
jgi:hypothetical protein